MRTILKTLKAKFVILFTVINIPFVVGCSLNENNIENINISNNANIGYVSYNNENEEFSSPLSISAYLPEYSVNIEQRTLELNVVKEERIENKEKKEEKKKENKDSNIEMVKESDSESLENIEREKREEENKVNNINVQEVEEHIEYATQTVNVRSGPDTSYNVLTTLSLNDEVLVNGKVNDWYQIVYLGSNAYVSSNYLSTEKVEIKTSGIVETLGSISFESIMYAENEIVKLPQNIIDSFKNDNWHFYLTTENIAQTMFQGQYNSVMGGTDYGNRTIKVSHNYSYIKESCLHEFGHYVYWKNNRLASTSDELTNAFNADVQNANIVGITYGLNDCVEFYAEVFYQYLNGNQNVIQYCPNMINIIQSDINNI